MKPDRKRGADLRLLAKILMAPRNENEMIAFIEDLFSPGERQDLLERWRLVGLLLQGIPQRDVSEKLGVSLSKVSRGSRVVQYGRGAFAQVWTRLKK
ncbi:MAG TPA: Trp family transcriptional regulator [Bdellovibrionota bacterium]|nr:Trp family transcriptional regulator [Bdellovibrionota bacterium]